METGSKSQRFSWFSHWWPVLAFLLIFGGGVYEFYAHRSENTLTLVRFILDGAVGLAVVVYVVYTHDLAKSSHIMADANLEMVKSMRSQSRQWVKDSKKQEYRTLLDILGGCVQEVIQLKFTPPPPLPKSFDMLDTANAEVQRQADTNTRITVAFLETARVMRDRLFIDDTLKKNDVSGDWKAIEQMAQDRPGVSQQQFSPHKEVFSIVEFQQAWEKLAAKIREVARQDLEAD